MGVSLMARTRVRIKVTWYRVAELKFNGVTLEVLQPVKTYETEEVGDPIDIMLKVSEENSKSSVGDYFEIIAEDREVKRFMGETVKRLSRQKRGIEKIFPRPSRLLKLGVVEKQDKEGVQSSGMISIRMEDVKWYTPRRVVYVYEGRVTFSSDTLALIVDTEHGRSILVKSRDRKRRASRPQS